MRGKVAEVAGSCIFCSMLSAKKRTAASSRVVQMLCWRSTAACVTICRRSSLRDSDKYTMLGRLGVSRVISIQCWELPNRFMLCRRV